MKRKIIIIAIICMFFNVSPKAVATDNDPQTKQTQSDITQTLIQQSKKIKLNKIIKYMQTRVYKTPYVFRGSSIYGWDCSGLVRYAYNRIGIELPHSADKQGHLGTRVSQPQTGDIVVFAYPHQTHFYHSALYLQNGLVLEANSYFGSTIIQPITNYKNKQIRFIRILNGINQGKTSFTN